MPTTRARSFQWSDLARRAGDVGTALDTYGEVVVVRGTQTLHLSPVPPSQTQAVFSDMCRLLAALSALDAPAHTAAILAVAWPWTRALPESARTELAMEVAPVAEMCESLGSFHALTDLLADWRRTARAYAEGDTPMAPVDEPLAQVATRPVS